MKKKERGAIIFLILHSERSEAELNHFFCTKIYLL